MILLPSGVYCASIQVDAKYVVLYSNDHDVVSYTCSDASAPVYEPKPKQPTTNFVPSGLNDADFTTPIVLGTVTELQSAVLNTTSFCDSAATASFDPSGENLAVLQAWVIPVVNDTGIPVLAEATVTPGLPVRTNAISVSSGE
jgi:hypothetical protein